ncbi:MAG: TonB-dependent receptor [Prevotellaceae bacterium]|jgi:TonB-linked SusC/RagA family outer membrane protein|nr:TonB-dependent receptor [Prevotellaceae bacterium]
MKALYFILISTLLLALPVVARAVTVTGTVKDANDQTLAGVSVVVKGSTRGVTTGANGAYSLSAEAVDVLVFSFLGMNTHEETVGSRNIINVALSEEASLIDEVVVVGYGSMRKKDLTGAVSSIKGEALAKIPVTTAAEALTGKVAGVQIVTAEGAPGASIKIRVRGGGSITQDNEPLYIIDGFPSDEGLIAVDPADIESIDVLKDASSTAIYGARGANGVIIITTRGGKEGKTTVSYDGYYGVKQLSRKMTMMNPYEFSLWQYDVRTIRDIYGASRTFVDYYGEWDDLYYNYHDSPGVDWQEELFGRTGSSQSHSVNVNGGTKTTKYNLGFTHNQEDGILVNTGYTRNIAKLKLDHKAFDNKVTFSVNVNYSDRDVLGSGEYGSTKRLIDALLYRPTMGIQYTDEQLLHLDQDETNTGVKLNNLWNPLKTQLSEYRNKRNTTTTLNGSADWEIIKGLNLKVLGGLSSDFSKNEQSNGSESKSGKLHEGGGIYARVADGEARKWSNTNTLTYKLDLEQHSMNFMVGNEQMSTTSKSVAVQTNYFPDVGIVLDNLGLGTSPSRPSSSVSTTTLLSFFGRAFYSYDNRYLMTATIRADGSSKFAAHNRWGYFPSISAAWRLDEEDFIKSIDVLKTVSLSGFKIRASYGQAGNNRIGNDQFLTTYNFGSYSVANGQLPAVYAGDYANPNLKWETTVSRNIGLDWAIFRGRLGGSLDWYMNDTRDLLIEQKVPSMTGYTTQYQNVGNTRNSGWELTINATPIAAKTAEDFQWTVDFNISFNKNKVTSLGGLTEFFYATGSINSGEPDYLVKVGESVGSMYGYVSDGYYRVEDFDFDATVIPSVSRQNDFDAYSLKAGVAGTDMYSLAPGVLKFKDISGAAGVPDGKIDSYDRTIIGDATPTHFGGLNNTFTWRGFDLSIFINWVYGSEVFNMNKLKVTSAAAYDNNALAIMNERWRVTDPSGNDLRYKPEALAAQNVNAKYPRPFTGSTYYQSWGVEDGSFLRLNNLTLGYSLPNVVLKKLHIQKLRVYATLNNVYVLTSYTGYDPEVNVSSSPLAPNVDYSAYPRTKNYIFGINFTF